MMSRKDYKQFAKMIRETRLLLTIENRVGHVISGQEAVNLIEDKLTAILWQDNPYFDLRRFRQEAYPEEDDSCLL